MMVMEHSVFINQPVSVVFSYIEDLNKRTEWETGVVEAKEVSGNYPEPGSVIEINSRVMGKKISVVAEVLEYEENKKVVCKANTPIPHEVANIYEEVDGGCKFTRRAIADPNNIKSFLKVGSSLVMKKIEKTLMETSKNAKKLLEKE